MFDIANLIEEAVEHRNDPARISAIRGRVREITARFPLPS
jgi:glycine/serine hydroxymethyltransferase